MPNKTMTEKNHNAKWVKSDSCTNDSCELLLLISSGQKKNQLLPSLPFESF